MLKDFRAFIAKGNVMDLAPARSTCSSKSATSSRNAIEVSRRLLRIAHFTLICCALYRGCRFRSAMAINCGVQ